MIYMLDTNTVSHFIKQHPAIVERITAIPLSKLCISAVTEAELLYGLAKRPTARKLHKAVNEFLHRVDVLPWNSVVANEYGMVRVVMESKGKVLGSLDMMIAAHALAVDVILVTNDKAFKQTPKLSLEDWSI